jgi:hypothetical protein
MAERNLSRPRVSREMRLLMLTIVVAGAVLLLLARFRFPEADGAGDATSQPLQRLAAGASFEELAIRVARFEASIAPDLIVLRLATRTGPNPMRLVDITSPDAESPSDVHHVPALRVDATTAVAVVPPHARISGIVGQVQEGETAGIVTTDPVRHVARIRVPEGRSRALPVLALSEFGTPAYVVAVEGTRAGLTLRPVFLGRSDRFGSPRWTRPLLPLGGALVTPGALLFTLDGQFLGAAVLEEGAMAIVGAADVLETAGAGRGSGAPVDPGIAVQLLTADLAQATGAPAGAVVADVVERSPASDVLTPGDVIVDVDGQPVTGPESLLLQLATRLATGSVRITVVRHRRAQTVELRPPAGTTERPTAPPDSIVLESGGAGIRVVSVSDDSSLARAGLTANDLIVRAGADDAPAPAELRAAIRSTPRGQFVLLVVKRGQSQRIVAIPGEGG